MAHAGLGFAQDYSGFRSSMWEMGWALADLSAMYYKLLYTITHQLQVNMHIEEDASQKECYMGLLFVQDWSQQHDCLMQLQASLILLHTCCDTTAHVLDIFITACMPRGST